MVPEPTSTPELWVLVATPTRRDAEVTCALLQQGGVDGVAFSELAPLAESMQAGVGAVMLTDAALSSAGIDRVFSILAEQPAWSDIPVILLTPDFRHSPATARALQALTAP